MNKLSRPDGKPVRFLLHPLFLILLGTALTVASALLSRYYVSANQESIQAAKTEAARKEALLNDTWQNVQALERKKDTIVLLAVASRGGALHQMPELVRAILISTEISLESVMKESQLSEQGLLKAIEAKKQELIDRVNDVYLEKSMKENEIAALQQRTSYWGDIALFLQILGLILVLSKDIDRYVNW